MLTRRQLVIALGGSVVAPLVALAQQPLKRPGRIGFLISESVSEQASRTEAFRAGLRDLGYVEGRNITVDVRAAEGRYEQLPALADELVHLKPDIIVPFSFKAATAAKRATTTIPIVVPSGGNPVALGLVASLSHPGGNITGMSNLNESVYPKRIEFLKQALPQAARVAVLINPANASSPSMFQIMAAAGKSLKIELQPFEVRTGKDIPSTLLAVVKQRFNAVVVQQDTLFIARATELVELMAQHRLPSVGTKEFAEAGGLLGYGVNEADVYRRAATYVDKILKGAKPGDLPFEQPSQFELVVNMRTAKSVGITIPRLLLVQATTIIE